MQLFVIRVQQSINMKEKWATETQSTIIPEEICHISDVFCDKVSLFVLPNVFSQKAQWETKAKIWLIRSVLDSFLHTDHGFAG